MILFFFTLENDGNVAAMLDFIRNAMAKVIYFAKPLCRPILKTTLL